jgi:tRNA (cytidine/uridine-2'-O-)-methyltransferase
MLDVVLFQPEIPPNTGNVIRLCANTGCRLHLIEPLGFTLDDARLRRAGLDYHEWATVLTHPSLEAYRALHGGQRLFAFSTRGGTRYDQADYRAGDALLFGPETSGLPQQLLDALPRERVLRLPMRRGSRSLNLSNSVAVVVFEAWRQLGFEGGV